MTAQMIQIAPATGIGGLLQGAFGNYQPASDGTYTVDTRDVPSLLAAGFSYVKKSSNFYTTPLAPPAAAIGGVVSSGALSNGTLAITTQPTVMRAVNIEVGTGTTAITAGTATVTYVDNGGGTTVDTFQLACALSSAVTQGLSRGVTSITSINIAGLVGGTSPWIRLSTTAAIAVPVAPNAVDVTFTREYDSGATVAIGTAATAIGCIATTGAPNGTLTYGLAYTYVSPVS